MSLSVKYAHHQMRGAPVLMPQPGSLLALLDAFLRTGFGIVTAQAVNVSGGIATATLNAGQGFEAHAIIQIDGATPAALNGQARVLPTTGPTQIQWATAAPDGPATGTITLRVAPVGGWERVFHDASAFVSVYRSADPQASGMYIRLDDSHAQWARVRCYREMSDINTGVNLCPTDEQANGGGYIWRADNITQTARAWYLFADSRFVLLGLVPALNGGCVLRGMGDFIPLSSAGDPWAAGVSCAADANKFSLQGGAFFSGVSNPVFLLRGWGGEGGAVGLTLRNYVSQHGVSGNDNVMGVFPSPVNGALYLCRSYLCASSNSHPRAEIPGGFHVPQTVPSTAFGAGDVLAGAGPLAGRRLIALPGAGSYGSKSGCFLVDTTGPWR